MTKQTFILAHQVARNGAMEAIRRAPDGYHVTIREPTRTLDQNARMWGMLKDISDQVTWYGQKLTDEEWKEVLSAALKRQKVVPGIDGGFVVIGARTSKMGKKEMSELQELMAAFGVEHGVTFYSLGDGNGVKAA